MPTPTPAKPIGNAKNEPTKPAGPNGTAAGAFRNPAERTNSKQNPLPVTAHPPNDHASNFLLRQAMKEGATVTLTLRSGAVAQGVIDRFDSFTITLRDSRDKRLRLYFKHGVNSIEFPEGFPPEASPQG